jgi:hypothetical protein
LNIAQAQIAYSLSLGTKNGRLKVCLLSSWQAVFFVQKKAAPKGGLSLGRKRPKRRRGIATALHK